MDPPHFTPLTVKKDDKTLTCCTEISFLLHRKIKYFFWIETICIQNKEVSKTKVKKIKYKKRNFYVNNTLVSYLAGNFYVNNTSTGHAVHKIEGLKHDHILIG